MPPPGSHSLRYFYTALSRPAISEPWYIAVGYLDDTQFVRFDSAGETGTYKLRSIWVEQEGPEYWARETEIVTSNAQFFRENLQTMLDYYNLSQNGEEPPKSKSLSPLLSLLCKPPNHGVQKGPVSLSVWRIPRVGGPD